MALIFPIHWTAPANSSCLGHFVSESALHLVSITFNDTLSIRHYDPNKPATQFPQCETTGIRLSFKRSQICSARRIVSHYKPDLLLFALLEDEYVCLRYRDHQLEKVLQTKAASESDALLAIQSHLFPEGDTIAIMESIPHESQELRYLHDSVLAEISDVGNPTIWAIAQSNTSQHLVRLEYHSKDSISPVEYLGASNYSNIWLTGNMVVATSTDRTDAFSIHMNGDDISLAKGELPSFYKGSVRTILADRLLQVTPHEVVFAGNKTVSIFEDDKNGCISAASAVTKSGELCVLVASLNSYMLMSDKSITVSVTDCRDIIVSVDMSSHSFAICMLNSVEVHSSKEAVQIVALDAFATSVALFESSKAIVGLSSGKILLLPEKRFFDLSEFGCNVITKSPAIVRRLDASRAIIVADEWSCTVSAENVWPQATTYDGVDTIIPIPGSNGSGVALKSGNLVCPVPITDLNLAGISPVWSWQIEHSFDQFNEDKPQSFPNGLLYHPTLGLHRSAEFALDEPWLPPKFSVYLGDSRFLLGYENAVMLVQLPRKIISSIKVNWELGGIDLKDLVTRMSDRIVYILHPDGKSIRVLKIGERNLELNDEYTLKEPIFHIGIFHGLVTLELESKLIVLKSMGRLPDPWNVEEFLKQPVVSELDIQKHHDRRGSAVRFLFKDPDGLLLTLGPRFPSPLGVQVNLNEEEQSRQIIFRPFRNQSFARIPSRSSSAAQIDTDIDSNARRQAIVIDKVVGLSLYYRVSEELVHKIRSVVMTILKLHPEWFVGSKAHYESIAGTSAIPGDLLRRCIRDKLWEKFFTESDIDPTFADFIDSIDGF